MKTICLEEQKMIMLDILVDVDDFCRKNNIQYFLVGGTLLGSVRHKGYIPWDDDIDIGLKRVDYEKFVAMYNGSNPNYRVLTDENTKDYYLPYAKVIDTRTKLQEYVHGIIPIGVNIDVFPFDYITDATKNDLTSILSKRNWLQYLIQIKSIPISKGQPIWKKMVILALRCFLPVPYTTTVKLKKRRVAKYISKCPTRWITNMYGAWGEKECVPASIFLKFAELEFEGKKVFGPADFDKYLKCIYGNYMQLPPKEKRVSHHMYEVYYM